MSAHPEEAGPREQSFRRCRGSLKPGGTFLTTDLGFLWHAPIPMLLTRWVGEQWARIGVARYGKQDGLLIKQLVETGQYRAVVDRCNLLKDVVEATRYVETGQKIGSAVLTVNGHRARPEESVG